MATWKDQLLDMDSQVTVDLNTLLIQQTEAKNHDVGIINPTSGAGILARENGRIDGFSDYGLGFRIDPKTQSISFFAPTIKFFCHSKQEFDYDESMNFIEDEYEDVMNLLSSIGDDNNGNTKL